MEVLNLRPGFQKFRPSIRGLEREIEEKWCVVSYLIINRNLDEIAKWAEIDPSKEFTSVLAKHVYGYVYLDETPPAEIEQTVLNVAEDMVAGREVQLRAGDYISVQKFIRGGKPGA